MAMRIEKEEWKQASLLVIRLRKQLIQIGFFSWFSEIYFQQNKTAIVNNVKRRMMGVTVFFRSFLYFWWGKFEQKQMNFGLIAHLKTQKKKYRHSANDNFRKRKKKWNLLTRYEEDLRKKREYIKLHINKARKKSY